MPPVDLAIMQSIVCWLFLPTVVSAGVMMFLGGLWTRRPVTLAVCEAIALLIGLTAGLAVQNSRGELIPFVAVRPVVTEVDVQPESVAESATMHWVFETGWYSLYSASVVAVLLELLAIPLRRLHAWMGAILTLLAVGVAADWLVPDDFGAWRGSSIAVFALIALVNRRVLMSVRQMRWGAWAPSWIALVWGGSAIVLTVLSHSARFADLAILLSSAMGGVGLGLLAAVGYGRRLNARELAETGASPQEMKDSMPQPPLAHSSTGMMFTIPAYYLPGLMLGAQQNTFSNIPLAAYLLLAVAPVAVSIVRWPRARTWLDSHPFCLVLLFAVPCVISIGLAARAEL